LGSLLISRNRPRCQPDDPEQHASARFYPSREITGCIHYENELLLEAERDLQDPQGRAAALLAPAADGAPPSRHALDAAACGTSGSRFVVEAEPKHGLLTKTRYEVLDHPKVEARGSTSEGSLSLRIQQPGLTDWQIELLTSPRPLGPGLYSVIAGYSKNNARVYFAADANGCKPAVARVLVHELSRDGDAGLLTFEVQCGDRNAVLHGCARFFL
jgi:hypothetical protein